ncbi:hypothetical protein Purlil1_8959 [Purpureocillium lilacinum]|uniref:2EXR domain-containing protein n=1 Tax=Purpureocillium lilacinum TaxID=33203 RepID=A0ABR0BS42_PURLI|nr:hypothetical protein Purlil1_8959 [Purpureocillium lilacinum]
MATSFTCFLRLPREIRELIWEWCLPCRVMDVDLPFVFATDPASFSDGDADEEICQFPYYHVKRNLKPPIVLLVCHESCEVVLRNGHYASGPLVGRNIQRLWVQPKRDMLNLNWDRTYDLTGHESIMWDGSYNYSPVPDTFAIADGLGVPAVVSHCTLQSFSKPHQEASVSAQEFRAPVDVQVLAGKRTPILMNVTTIVLHMKEKDATSRGQFGLFGDEPVQLVGINDDDKLRAYYRLWAENCAMTDPWAKDIFKVLLCDSLKQCFLQEWRQKLDFIFIGTLWVEARQQGFHGMENPQSVWAPPVSDDRCPDRALNAMCADHSWVQMTRASLPVIVPLVMFRWCDDRRCWDQETYSEWDKRYRRGEFYDPTTDIWNDDDFRENIARMR